MRGPHNIWRLIRAGATFERTGAMRTLLDLIEAPRAVRIMARGFGAPFQILGLRGDATHPPMLRAIIALGPAYIKFGQLLSTRPDVVGVALAEELKILQDRLPAFAQSTAIAEVEKELGITLTDIFTDFTPPVAAASIAQVHKATLRETGQQVAIKILRPNIERDFARDVNAFNFAAAMVEWLAPKTRRLRPKAVTAHFEHIVRNELDLRQEAALADEFAHNTAGDAGFGVPKVLWPLCARRVMTAEWVDGLSLGDIKGLRKSGRDLPDLGARIITMFLRHALRDGLFHGDMHQGNLKLNEAGDLVALDFGIMGRIDEYTRRVYAEILMGFITKDYRRIAEVHFEAGYVPQGQDVMAFAQALRSVGEPIFGQSADKISMARLLAHLFEVTAQFGMETRTELILLQRTMVVVEGVARTLNPDLNLWTVAKPEVETYIKNHLGAAGMIRDGARVMQSLARLGPKLPAMIDDWESRMKADVPVRKSGWVRLGWFVLGAGVVLVISVLVISD